MKVLALIGSGHIGGCEIYRVTLPFYYMSEQFPIDVAWATIEDLKQGLRDETLKLTQYDAFLLPRTLLGTAKSIMPIFQAAGKKFIFELDDDLIRRDVMGEERTEEFLETIRQADAVFVSTRHLEGQVRKWGVVCPTYELPNCVDLKMWGRHRETRTDERLTIGLTGSKTHATDWVVLRKVLPRIAREFPEVRILIAGFVPDYLQGLGFDERPDFTSYEQYVRLIREIDIGLCPIDPDDKFNKSKSAIKAIELMASTRRIEGLGLGGAAVIATRSQVYMRAVRQRRNGLLVQHFPVSWYVGIKTLIENAVQREKYQVAGHRWARRHRGIEQNVYKWYNAFQEIIGGGRRWQGRQ